MTVLGSRGVNVNAAQTGSWRVDRYFFEGMAPCAPAGIDLLYAPKRFAGAAGTAASVAMESPVCLQRDAADQCRERCAREHVDQEVLLDEAGGDGDHGGRKRGQRGAAPERS